MRWLCCLLVQVRDDTPEEIQRNVEQAVPIYLEHNGVIVDVVSSIQFVTFGILGGSKEKHQGDRKKVSDDLLGLLKDDVKIVTFEGDISCGLIGTDKRISYTVLLPKFDRCLAVLLDTKFGRISELGSLL